MISEYPVGSSIQKYRYVERDKVQSEISQGIMIIEADENSGIHAYSCVCNETT